MRKTEAVIVLLYLLATFILLPVMNYDLLYAIEENSLYVPNSTFTSELTGDSPLGFMTVWSCWLTQHFYYPWIGTCIFAGISIFILILYIYALNTRGLWSIIPTIPLALSIWNIVGIGYRLYFLNTPGYFYLPIIKLLAYAVIISVVSFLIKRFLHPLPHLHTAIVCTPTFVVWFIILSPLHYGMPDKRFSTELKMNRAINEFRYNDVIEEFTKHNKWTPTNLMVLYKNIALLHTHRLTEMFSTGNCGELPTIEDSTMLSINRTVGPEIYYHLGQFNYAYRQAMENSVNYGLNVSRLKIMAQCSIMNLEMDVAYKYLTQLRLSPYHHKWALEHDRMLRNFAPLYESKEYKCLQPFVPDTPDELDTDNGVCERYILDTYSSMISDNPQLEDFCMCCALWKEDTNSFLHQFIRYINRYGVQSQLPILYQEALVMLAAEDDFPFDINVLQIDPINSRQRYQHFAETYYRLSTSGLNTNEIGNAMKAEFGHTYWWYYYFYNDFMIY